MGEVTISVAGRAYQVICEDGEEDRLTSIAARVESEAQVFSGASPSLSEARLLLMCSLLLADKLDEAETSTTAPLAAAPSQPATVLVEADTSGIEEAITRISELAGGIPSDASEVAEEPVAEAAVAPDIVQEDAPARPSKSSAATAAEKDLLSWLDRPEPRGQSPVDPPAPEPDEQADMAEAAASTPDDQVSETVEDSAEAPVAEDATHDTAAPEETMASEETTVESEEDRAALERSERRARRRTRLARLAKQEETGD